MTGREWLLKERVLVKGQVERRRWLFRTFLGNVLPPLTSRPEAAHFGSHYS
jgi:hypothetical protein